MNHWGTRSLLALVCSLLVGWIWHLPQTLVAADALADQSIRRQIMRQVARDKPADLKARTDLWMRDNAAQVEAARLQLAQGWREALSFTAADGRRHAYLGDLDSYAWVREAQNFLRHGTTCDDVRNGECRDSFVNPPHGARMFYRRSLHIGAIVGLHRIVTWFEPHFPLTTSAAWVAILGGALISLLAFAVGRCLAGTCGGVAAALLIPLHPFVLERCLGSDNDVWVVALPLLFAGITAAGFDAAVDWRRRAALLAGAGLVAGLLAMTWNGWMFHGVVVLLGAALYVASRRIAPCPDQPQRRTLLMAFVVLASTLVAAVVLLAGVEGVAARLVEEVTALLPTSSAAPHATAAEAGVWPSMLAAVTELQPTTFQRLVPEFLGRVGCWICFTGFALVLLPQRSRWWAYAGAVLYGALLTLSADRAGFGSRFYLSAVIVPLVAAFLWRLRRDDAASRWRCIDLILAVWFVAALLMSFRGTRLVLLMVTPFALVAAVVIGRGAALLAEHVARWWRRRWLTDALVTAAVVACLVPAISQGHAAAAAYTPVLNTAWWNVLNHLRTRSAEDAIVTSWWDYGYWVKYIAERRTTADGASLASHRPYWVARTLVSGDPQEAAGLLRIQNCGGDNIPFPEGELSAYGRIQSHLRDAVQSQSLLVELARQSAEAAATTLTQRGFTAPQQALVLATTHCEPPESYLVLNREMISSSIWLQIGMWDFRKAYIVEALRHTKAEAVIVEAQQRFGFSPQAATELVEQAQRQGRFAFISGRVSRLPPVWYPCRPGATAAALDCPIELEEPTSGRAIEAVEVSLMNPAATRLRVSYSGQVQRQVPAKLLVARDALVDVPVQPDADQDLGVLVDVEQHRVMLGQPAFLASLYVRLIYLDGRYAPGFEKVFEEAAPRGDRISLWRVRFAR